MQILASGATVEHIDRGGELTFHGPGQIVMYPVFSLRDLGVGARAFVKGLESSMVATLGAWGLHAKGDPATSAGVRRTSSCVGSFTGLCVAERGAHPRRICGCLYAVRLMSKSGVNRAQVWVGDAKVGAIGVRISRGVAYHGLALNVNTDLSWYEKIVPCGQTDKPVTTVAQLLHQSEAPLRVVERQLMAHLCRVFGHAECLHITQQALAQSMQNAGCEAVAKALMQDHG